LTDWRDSGHGSRMGSCTSKAESRVVETIRTTVHTQAVAAMDDLWPIYATKMKAEGLDNTAIAAFKYSFGMLVSGLSTMIPESSIGPVDKLPELGGLSVTPKPELLKETVVLKLNGGLGTGMGLDKAKSLLPVIEGNTFLDLIAKQVFSMRKEFKTDLAFMLMNSFSTSADTIAFLSKYKELETSGLGLAFLQNKAPKVIEKDLMPANWPKEKAHEWCPPGHGDLYPAIMGSGTLEKLLERGFKYMFVSNSDNLGATMDLNILTYFAESKAPFMMEVAHRTNADKKGGHLARDLRTGGLLLRESAQCPSEDEKAFQDVSKYIYFNTNNLWVDLRALKAAFQKHNGAIPLPVMKNGKTVDPRDKNSTKVIQLETAMGAAISCFEGAIALKIPRSRFAPVKTTDDLLALRSDAYVLTPDFRIELAASRGGVPPNVKLDSAYKFVDAMNALTPSGAPSLVACDNLVVQGPVEFAAGVVIKGSVTIKNSGDTRKVVASGTYVNTTIDLSKAKAIEPEVETVVEGEVGTAGYRLRFRRRTGTEISPWHDIPLYTGEEGVLNFVVEIPKMTKPKMEVATKERKNPIAQDVKKGKLRDYHGPIFWNYGMLPQTWEDPGQEHPELQCTGDDDPLDVVEIGSQALEQGAVVQIKVLGVLAMIDDGELDWKIIAIRKDDPFSQQFRDISDVEAKCSGMVSGIREWLRWYKTPDGKPLNTFGFAERAMDRTHALKVVGETHDAWRRLHEDQAVARGKLWARSKTDISSTSDSFAI